MNMNKNVRENAGREGPAMRGPSPLSPTTMWYVTLAGLAVLLFLGFQSWAGARRIEQTLNDRLAQLDTRITQLSAKVDSIPKTAAAPRRRGPDPNRVYAVKTEGRPFKGPKNAPVTIAEFSDFQ